MSSSRNVGGLLSTKKAERVDHSGTVSGVER